MRAGRVTWDHYRRWLGELAPNFAPLTGEAPTPNSLCTDTRSLQRGEWFVPIDGAKFDGHAFLGESLARGASGVFYAAKRRRELSQQVLARGIEVIDPLAAMQAIASGWRRELRDLALVAVTGSTGKTTTKEMLAAILRAAGPTYSTEMSFNNEIGVPKSLLKLSPEHRFAALEFGARKAGDIRFLAEMAAPNVCGVLNVGKTHVEIFGSIEALLQTKLEMFRDSPGDATLVAFADDPRILSAARAAGKRVVTFGSGPGVDVRMLSEDWTAGGKMRVTLEIFGTPATIHLGVAHAAFPINAAAAAALAAAAGVKPEAAMRGLSGFTGIKGRYQVHRTDGLTVIDDTYNASPDSMRAGLQTVTRSFGDRPLVLVLGDMLELGSHAADEHRTVGLAAGKLNPKLLITVGPLARHISEGAVSAGLRSDKILSFPDVGALLASPLDVLKRGEVLYAKASRGIGLDKLVQAIVGSPKP